MSLDPKKIDFIADCAAELAKRVDVARKDVEPGTKFKKGDKIKENRQGANVETVMSQTENMIETYEGNRYHVTKVVRA